MKFDDGWFIGNRYRLLAPYPHPEPPHVHLVRGILEDSRHAGHVDPDTENALGHLAPRHQSAVRAHMQFYRAVLEVIGFLPSDAIVNAAVKIEWLWYTTPFKSFYRDHLAHVMKVALIALDFLENPKGPFAKGKRPLLDRVARDLARGTLGKKAIRTAARRCGNWKLDEDFWRSAVVETTRIAGLLHDMAYPDVMAVKVDRAAKPVRPRAPFEPGLEDTCRNAVAHLQHHLVASPFHGGSLPSSDGIGESSRRIAETVFRESHSLRAGYSLLRILEDARRTGAMAPFDAFVMEWAALAASLHDYDKFYDDKHLGKTKEDRGRMITWLDGKQKNRDHIRPSYKEDPVSFLVALADQIQDFGRMHYQTDKRAGQNTASANVCYPCEAVEVDVDGGNDLQIVLHLGSRESCFGPTDENMARDIEKTKLREPAFSRTAKPVAPGESKDPGAQDHDPWLIPGKLYKEARIRVIGGGRDVTTPSRA